MKNNSKRDYFHIDWVLVNELAIGTPPKNKKDLIKLKNEKVKSVLSLCSQEEAILAERINDIFICKRIYLPDHKTGKNIELKELLKALSILEDLIRYGPVFVHCVAAVERSPIVCMGWLVKKHNLSPIQALEYLMQAHPGTNPLPRQFELIKKINTLKN